MYETIQQAFDELPALGSRKSPQKAAADGFPLGGIGLGIYFVSFIDFVLPVAAAMLLVVGFNTFATFGVFGAAILSSVYGYMRARSSNHKFDLTNDSLRASGEVDFTHD